MEMKENDLYEMLDIAHPDVVGRAIRRWIVAIALLVLVIVLCSCGSAKTVTVTEYRDSTVCMQHFDTLIVRQTDSVDRWRRGDTVYLERWRVKETTKIVRDTVSRTIEKAEPYEVDVVKEVVPQWSWWMLAIVVGIAAFWTAKIIYKIKK